MNIVRSGLKHLLLKTKMGEHNTVKIKRGVSKWTWTPIQIIHHKDSPAAGMLQPSLRWCCRG